MVNVLKFRPGRYISSRDVYRDIYSEMYWVRKNAPTSGKRDGWFTIRITSIGSDKITAVTTDGIDMFESTNSLKLGDYDDLTPLSLNGSETCRPALTARRLGDMTSILIVPRDYYKVL